MSMTYSKVLEKGLERAAAREGVTVEALTERWLLERISDDMRRRMLEAAGANKPDPMVVHDAPCAVTLFDMHVRLMSDGRERGLWIFLRDTSPGRERQHRDLVALDPNNPSFNGGRLEEGALLEWHAAKAFYKAMGKVLKEGDS